MENLTRNHTILLLHRWSFSTYKGVRGRGNVKVSYDVNHNVLIAQKIHMRYLGNLEPPMAHELIDAIKKGQSVVLEISPKYYSTWDYSKQWSYFARNLKRKSITRLLLGKPIDYSTIIVGKWPGRNSEDLVLLPNDRSDARFASDYCETYNPLLNSFCH